MSLLNLSTELILLIASHLRQVDLLNISLVCKQLNVMAEPELYREYNNPRLYNRSLWPFIRRLIRRPELAKHVRSVDLFEWEYVDTLEPLEFNGRIDDDREDFRKLETQQDDYALATQAAKLVGVIETIDTYAPTSRLLDRYDARVIAENTVNGEAPWYDYMIDDHLTWEVTPYDRKFCQLLHAGVEDAQVVLLLALLPNVQDILMRGGPHMLMALPWRASHNFQALRTLTVCGTMDLVWPLGNLVDLLRGTPRLTSLQVQSASSWYRGIGEPEPDPANVVPLTLQPGSLSCLGRLVLKYCMLRTVDLSNLIQACSGLKSLFYYKGEYEGGPHNLSPAKVIELLAPLKNSLEELSLDLDVEWHENIDSQVTSRISSLSHMTALKILDTTPEMWSCLDTEEMIDLGHDVDADAEELPSDANRLCYRLPRSLESLFFHASEEELEPAMSQMRDLMRMRPHTLPNLKEVIVCSNDRWYETQFDEVLEEVEQSHIDAGLEPLIGDGGCDSCQVDTVFDLMQSSSALPDTKWFINKYSAKFRKPRTPAAMRKKMNVACAQGISLVEAATEDPELDDYLKNELLKEKGPPEYYDSDEENIEFDY